MAVCVAVSVCVWLSVCMFAFVCICAHLCLHASAYVFVYRYHVVCILKHAPLMPSPLADCA